jgi:predicted permease
MEWFSQIRRRLAVLWRRDRFDRDLEEEMQSHLELQAQEHRESGMPAREARAAAHRQFGNALWLKESSRDLWGWGPVERLARDLRYAARGLRQNPGFAAVATLSLALGIGANTAIFTVVNAVLLRSLPVRSPEQLVIVHSSIDGPVKGVRVQNSYNYTDEATGRRYFNTFSLAAVREFRAKASGAVDAFAFFSPGKVAVSEGSGSRPAFLTVVSGNFFEGLGVPMTLGRGLMESDDEPGSRALVVTSSFWEHSLNADAAILGKMLRLNGVPVTVVGVTGAAFHGISAAGFDGPADVFAPLHALATIVPDEFRPSRKPKTAPDSWWIQVMARRRSGITAEAAAARLTAVYRGTFADSGMPALQAAKNPRILLDEGDKGLSPLRAKIERPLLILLVVAGLVLLLACVNMATLQLARSAARQREMAVRLSLGAGRGRVVRQLLIESLFLSSLGAIAGVAMAAWGAPLVAHFLTAVPAFDAVWLDLSPDLRILGFTLLATVLTGVLFGLAPAWQATGVDIASNLKDNARAAGGRSHFRLGKVLIAGQAALSLVLLTGSGLFLRTLWNLYKVDAGFDRDRLLLFRLDAGQLAFKPAQTGPIYDAILQSISATPGVRSAAAMSHALIGGWNNSTELASAETEWQPLSVLLNTVTPEFFTTMRMPLVEGRAFSPRDSDATRRVVILNQSAARRLCGDGPAVGRIIRRFAGGDQAVEVEVIGVARDAKFNDLRRPIEPTVFVPFQQSYPFTGRVIVLRTAGDPMAMVGPVRRAIAGVNGDVAMTDVKTQTGLIEESLHQERLFSALLTLFAGFSLLLAAIGLHGVTAYSTARRTGEIGLRMALGAGREQVLALILRQVLRPVAVGTAIGLAVGYAATRWIESMLFGVKRLDVSTFLGAFLLLAAVAMLAAFLPAWRATKVDPMTALRAE